MRGSWLVVLAACGGSSEPTTGGAGSGSDPVIVKPVAAPPAVRPVTGMHGASIALVAVTDAGDAAVTADRDGALRLWPALDGSREPIAVTGQSPRAIEVAREGDGFVIANHDAANGVELVRLDPRGGVRSRARIAAEPPVVQVELTPSGALVLRADQAIELHDASGVQRSRLVPEPGTRIAMIVERGGRALAIVGDDKHARARWIELGPATAAWGAWSPKLELDPTRPIALSPDHRRLLGSRSSSPRIPALVDLTTGKLETTLVCMNQVGVDDLRDPLHRSFPEPGALLRPALGFATSSTIACSAQSQLGWWTVEGAEIPAVGERVNLGGELEPALGGGRVFGAVGPQLAMWGPTTQQFLGYGFHELSHLRVAPIGVVIGKGDQAPLLLGPDLREQARYPLPKGTLEWTDLLPLDERYVLRMSSRAMRIDAWGTAYEITVFDMTRGVVHQQLPNIAQEVTLAYEPATRLLATSDGQTNLLLRYDLATHAFGERFEVDEPQPLRGIYLLDPALSGGLVALTVEDRDGAVMIGELHGDDLQGTTIRARRSYPIPGQLRAVDRSGRVYAQGAAAADVVVYARGTQFARLAGIGGMTLRPSPDAMHVAAFRDGKVRLLAVDGQVLWDVALWGSADVDWTASGELIARYKAALARLDRATGALRERQCGWSFGIADTPFELGADLPSVCDVSP
jgi:hypothetical protein